jgi:hypothetical protein
MNSKEYVTRCAALTRRGLSLTLASELVDAGNTAALLELEAAPDQQLAEVSSLYRGLSATAQVLARAVIAGRAVCDARAAACHCVKDPGHVEAGDEVHACDPKVCTGEWTGTYDQAQWDGGRGWNPVVMPRPVAERLGDGGQA